LETEENWSNPLPCPPAPPGLIHGHQKKLNGWGDKGTRGQGEEREFNDFSFVCVISTTQINFSIYNELALPAPLLPCCLNK